jgi:hypothetical protein
MPGPAWHRVYAGPFVVDGYGGIDVVVTIDVVTGRLVDGGLVVDVMELEGGRLEDGGR